jgi:phosphoribosylanthranilate isomerase
MRTRIKVCGITRLEDLAFAANLGVDAIGFVFYPKSSRAITLHQAKPLVAATPPFVSKVGLFVNAEPSAVRECLASLYLDVLQFHGDETPEYCQQFSRPWIKALRITPDINLIECTQSYSEAGGLLLDADVAGFGGGGKAFDWSLIPQALPRNFILSGGLNAENVGNAVRQVRPWAVDVSSGVEALDGMSKGIKDAVRMAQFMAEVVRADSEIKIEADQNADARHVI